MVKNVEQYIETSKKLIGSMLYYCSGIDELKKDIRDYRDNKFKFLDFQRKYRLKYSTKKSLNGSLRRAYNYLEKSQDVYDRKRGNELRDSYERKIIIKKKLWNNTIALWYPVEFQNEKLVNKPRKKFGMIGYYKHISKNGIAIEDFIKNITGYLQDSKQLVMDIRDYFGSKCFFSTNSYRRARHTPYNIRIRVFMYDVYSDEEKVCNSGHVDIRNYISSVKNILKKYYNSAIKKQNSYNDRPKFWKVYYICIDSKMKHRYKFRKELGLKKSFYGNFF